MQFLLVLLVWPILWLFVAAPDVIWALIGVGFAAYVVWEIFLR